MTSREEMRPRQLNFAFADSPQGGKGARSPDVSGGKAHLLRLAECRTSRGRVAPPADASQLMELVAWPPNLAVALLNVARNKGASGVDGESVEEVVEGSRRLLPVLHRGLLDGTYQPGDIKRVWIPKPGGGQRGLGIPNVVDRWVQQAVVQVMEPIFEPSFHPSSHGFRPNRGVHTAIAEAKACVEEGFNVVVDMDISRFFDTVNHQRLLAHLGKKIADGRLLDLIRRMLKAKVVMPDGTRVLTQEGAPQGGPLSPLLSNVVLDELDRELERRGLRFVRYADDCNIYVRSVRAGERVLEATRRFLERRLRLKLNDEKSGVRSPEETHFLGFCFCEGEAGRIEVCLSKRSRERLNRKVVELSPRCFGQSLATLFANCNAYLKGWISAFKVCTRKEADTFRRVDGHLRRRIRALIIRRLKRPRFLLRHLMKRGVSREKAARVAYSRKGIWWKSGRTAVNLAYPIRWFEERLVTLVAEWERLNQPPALASGQLLLFPS
jgi:RNA-directed DNA polymerase